MTITLKSSMAGSNCRGPGLCQISESLSQTVDFLEEALTPNSGFKIVLTYSEFLEIGIKPMLHWAFNPGLY